MSTGILYLMHKDTKVLNLNTFTIINSQFLPYGLYNRNNEITGLEVYKWLSRRAIPLNRKNADKIYEVMKQNRDSSSVDLMIQTHALSINDNYWVAYENELDRLKWHSINLYSNKLSESLMKLAFTGSGSAVIADNELSPEFTGQGTYAKCFRRTQGGLEICKQGSDKEIIAEVYSSLICELLGIKCINYKAGTLLDKHVSISKIYTNEHISWVSAFEFAHFVEQAYSSYIYDFTEKYFKQMYYAMILIDGLTLNEDRHLQNWSIQVSGDTNHIIDIAPLYDFNKSFTGNYQSMSNFIKNKNLLSAARTANDVLKLDLITPLYRLIDKLPFEEWKESLYNRILYMQGKKSNQNNCY